MECRIYTESLTALMDGELTANEESAVKRHLAGCPSCNAEYKSLEYSYGLVDNLNQLNYSPDSWQNIEKRLKGAAEKQGFFSRFKMPGIWIPAGAFATFLLLTASLMMYVPSGQKPDRLNSALQSYIQQREQDFLKKGFMPASNRGKSHFVTFNPFAEPSRRPKENPFRLE